MEPTAFDVDELIEFWTLLDEDRALLAGKRGATALGFAVLLKHYSRHGQFPRGRSEVPDDVIVFVAGQLGVDAADLGFYEWSGSTIEYHRAQVRDHLGYRVATVADQERLTVWLSEAVAHAERRPDRVREELLAEFRRLRIEPPTPGRLVRMVRSALRTAEQNWASRIAGRLNPSATARLLSLIAHRGIRSVKP
jgi:Transposase.